MENSFFSGNHLITLYSFPPTVCSTLYFLSPIMCSSIVYSLLYYFSPIVYSLLYYFSPIVYSLLYFLSPIVYSSLFCSILYSLIFDSFFLFWINWFEFLSEKSVLKKTWGQVQFLPILFYFILFFCSFF